MAREWTLEAARGLLHQWNRSRVEGAVRDGGLAVDLGDLERWLLDQAPTSLAEAERLLEMIATYQTGTGGDPGGLCGMSRAGRNDVGSGSRVEVSFAPRASGPMAGRA